MKKHQYLKRQIGGCLVIMLAVCMLSCKDDEAVPDGEQDSPVEVKALCDKLTSEQVTELENVGSGYFEYFKAVNKTSRPHSNVVCSPLGMQFAMSMLAEGVNEAAKQEILQALNTTSVSTLNEINKIVIKNVDKVAANTTVKVANSFWYDYSLKPCDSFVDYLSRNYNASVYVEDFSAGIAGKINNWCGKSTDGMIPRFIDEGFEGVYVLLNALCFKSPWDVPFDKQQTFEEPYYGQNMTNNVKMMHNEAIQYCFGDSENAAGCKAVKLSCGSGAFSVTFVLPSVDDDIDEFIHTTDFKALLSGLRKNMIKYSLPKFDLTSSEIDLEEPLRALGVATVFETGTDKMFENYRAGIKMAQRTMIRFDEKGAEAASVTGSKGDMFMPSAAEINLNRPFVFFIQEESTGIVLFAGKILDL